MDLKFLFTEMKQRIYFFFRKDLFTVSQVLSLEPSTFTKGNRRKIKFFKQKGHQCVSCDRKGTFFKKERKIYNLYTHDGILMTQDHIKPKSKGGSNSLFNLQPMCFKCNLEKGDDMPDKFVFIIGQKERKDTLNRIKNISNIVKMNNLSTGHKDKISKYISFLINKNILSLLTTKELNEFKRIQIKTFQGLIEINDLLLKRI